MQEPRHVHVIGQRIVMAAQNLTGVGANHLQADIGQLRCCGVGADQHHGGIVQARNVLDFARQQQLAGFLAHEHVAAQLDFLDVEALVDHEGGVLLGQRAAQRCSAAQIVHVDHRGNQHRRASQRRQVDAADQAVDGLAVGDHELVVGRVFVGRANAGRCVAGATRQRHDGSHGQAQAQAQG